jgi:hypothetical protein
MCLLSHEILTPGFFPSKETDFSLQSLGEVYLICLYFVCTVFTTVGFGACVLILM